MYSQNISQTTLVQSKNFPNLPSTVQKFCKLPSYSSKIFKSTLIQLKNFLTDPCTVQKFSKLPSYIPKLFRSTLVHFKNFSTYPSTLEKLVGWPSYLKNFPAIPRTIWKFSGLPSYIDKFSKSPDFPSRISLPLARPALPSFLEKEKHWRRWLTADGGLVSTPGVVASYVSRPSWPARKRAWWRLFRSDSLCVFSICFSIGKFTLQITFVVTVFEN